MKDSFDNELQVGDRVLCLRAMREGNMHRKNQVGTIAKADNEEVMIRGESQYEVTTDNAEVFQLSRINN